MVLTIQGGIVAGAVVGLSLTLASGAETRENMRNETSKGNRRGQRDRQVGPCEAPLPGYHSCTRVRGDRGSAHVGDRLHARKDRCGAIGQSPSLDWGSPRSHAPSTFCHRLRRRKKEALVMIDRQAAPAPSILLVDDDAELLSLHAMLLSESGLVVTSSSPAEALRMLASRPFDVVITDYQMPGQNGVWFLEQVRAAYPSIGRVLVSGSRPPGLDDLVKSGLVQAFHRKPVAFDAFIRCPLTFQKPAVLAGPRPEINGTDLTKPPMALNETPVLVPG